jgi:hypothetical protein
VNGHHRIAVRVLSCAIALDIVTGVCFSFAQHVGVPEGLYYATGVATTIGADISPHGWLPHVLTVVMMTTIIPLFAAVFSLFTTGLTADHVDKRHREMSVKIEAVREA